MRPPLPLLSGPIPRHRSGIDIHITELHREHPGVASGRHQFAVSSRGETEHAEAAEETAADGNVDVASTDTVRAGTATLSSVTACGISGSDAFQR
jgi:hypothetical protein